MRDQDIRTEMIRICHWLARQTFVVADDGALSARISRDQILITPRGKNLGWVTCQQLVLLNMDGQQEKGKPEPSPAYQLHLAAYRHRDKIQAVIHAQPPTATAFAVAGIPLVQPVLPETVLTLGSVPVTEYATPYTEEAARAIGDLIGEHDALLLRNRGLLAVGCNLSEALQKLERVEQLARVLLKAKSLDHVDLLTGTQVKKLMSLRERMNLGGKNPWSPADQEKNDG